MTAQPGQTEKVGSNKLQLPHLLYHYTDQTGLIGILETKRIWATHARYLNDVREGKIVVDVLRQRLKEIQNKPEFHNLPIKKLHSNIKELVAHLHIFIASFSERGNLLSQWRAYSGATGGYSIGFNSGYLRDIGGSFLSTQENWFRQDTEPLKRCLYMKEESKGGFSLISSNSDPGAKREATEDERNQSTAQQSIENFVAWVQDMAATMKHAGFKEEAEWRIALFFKDDMGWENPNLRFRPGGSMPSPYIEIDLQSGARRIAIEKIFVGPCPNPKEAVQSVEFLEPVYDLWT